MIVAFNLIGKYDEVIIGVMFNPRVIIIDNNSSDKSVKDIEHKKMSSMMTIGMLFCRLDILFK